MFIVLVWLLISVLVAGWLEFHFPGWSDWRPQTFGQFCIFLFGGMSWAVLPIILMEWLSPKGIGKKSKY